ncbi:MAG TPA: type II toxin-antitoxin system VapC family toxin [Acidobacteriaceae bacterium]|nr:type II toxin-antitoxin system VapC family toxin [Acidobacteriaceae bacterium]
MNVLIDSHALIWGTVEPDRLSKTAERLMADGAHNRVVSMASLWEITIKMANGKLVSLGASIQHVMEALRSNGVQILPVRASHLIRLESLPHHHRDPFDRLLIAQAIEEDLAILTDDAHFRRYPVKTIW